MRKRVFAGVLAMSAVAAMGVALPASAAPPAAPAAPAVKGQKMAIPYDFNGDGRADLALGSPYGKISKLSNAGFITVVYGGTNGPDSTKKKYFSQNSAGVPGTAEAGDEFGYALASLDINKDGYADLIVGAPGEDTTIGTDSGSETIIWGTAAGLSTYADSQDGYHKGEGLGFSITAGDFDGDSYGDWADATQNGAFYWYSSAPVPSAGRFAFAPKLHKVGTAVRSKRAATMHMGPAASGDVNGDGLADVILTAQGSTSGEVDVLTVHSDGIMYNDKQASTLVTSVAAGDFDGDGFADIAVGDSSESKGKGGQVTILNGDKDLTLTARPAIGQDTDGVPGTAVAGDHFGASVAAGDINKDGKSDLVVGVPYKVVSGKSQAGESVVLYDGVADSNTQTFSQSTTGVSGVAETGDRFGWAASLLDTNGDGFADPVIGSPKENTGDGVVTTLKGSQTVLTGTGSVTFGAGTLGVSGRGAQIGVRVGHNG